MKLNQNNLAELLSVRVSSDELQCQWEDFMLTHKDSMVWDFRVFLTNSMLSDYFKIIVASVQEAVQEVPKYLMLQVYDKKLYCNKKSLNIVHRDDDRSTCITIPLSYNHSEPVLFYNDIPSIVPENYRKTQKPWPEKPNQIGKYSANHPTLVNVQNLHSVRVIDEESPRILFQLSFDSSFEEIINRNPSLWRIIT